MDVMMPSSLIDRLDALFVNSRGSSDLASDDDFQLTLERIRQQLRYSALSINVSGRLRMLLQKSTKEFFMILYGYSGTSVYYEVCSEELGKTGKLCLTKL